MITIRNYLFVGLIFLGLGCPFRVSGQQPTNAPAQTNLLQAELDAATKQVEKIINQPVTAYQRTAGMKVGKFSPGWFHEGASRPDFNNVDVRTTRESPYDKYEYVCSDLNTRIVFVGRQLEFNSMTKYFYKDRTVPKKKLTEAEMVEVNRLYRIIGHCEQQLAQLRNPEPTSDSASTSTSNSDEAESPAPPGKTPRLLNPYTGGGLILVLVILYLIFKRRT